MIDWEWIADQGDQIWERTIEHVTLTVIAVVVGLLVSALLALVALRNRRTYAPITWISGVLHHPQHRPLRPSGPLHRAEPAHREIGLVSYTLLILVRNIVAGIDGCPRRWSRRRGVGYTDREVLRRVQIPWRSR